MKTNVRKTELFQKFVAGEIGKKSSFEAKALNKKIEDLCKNKNLALIRHIGVNENCLAMKKKEFKLRQ